VAGRVDRLQVVGAAQRHLDGDAAHGLGGELLGVQRIDVLHQSALLTQHLGVAQAHALFAARLDGEYAHLEQPLAGVLHQGRVAHAPDDILVDLPRLGGVEQFRLGHLAVDVHGEAVDLGAGGDREDVRPLQPGGGGIVERLVHLGHGHLVGDRDGDVVVLDGQRRERVRLARARVGVRGDDEPVGPGETGRQCGDADDQGEVGNASHRDPPGGGGAVRYLFDPSRGETDHRRGHFRDGGGAAGLQYFCGQGAGGADHGG